MGENIIRFPGFLVAADRNGCWKDGRFYRQFTEMVRDLPERDRLRTYHWHLKREGRPNYRAAVLAGVLGTNETQVTRIADGIRVKRDV
jgi:hypothetical protein